MRASVGTRDGRTIADLELEETAAGWSGSLLRLHREFRDLFERFDDAVNDQLFSHLDAIEAEIRALRPLLTVPNRPSQPVATLQLHPGTGGAFVQTDRSDEPS